MSSAAAKRGGLPLDGTDGYDKIKGKNCAGIGRTETKDERETHAERKPRIPGQCPSVRREPGDGAPPGTFQ